MKLSDLGSRICIIGPSNSGKSTLANAISEKLNLKATHLDQLFHLADSDWQPRPYDEFITLHDKVINEDKWVIDGNYKKALPQRLSRATGLILLDIPTLLSLSRYMNRTLLQSHRHGGLSGDKERIKWEMIHHIIFAVPKSRKRHTEIYESLSIPKIKLMSVKEINQQYKEWELSHYLNR